MKQVPCQCASFGFCDIEHFFITSPSSSKFRWFHWPFFHFLLFFYCSYFNLDDYRQLIPWHHLAPQSTVRHFTSRRSASDAMCATGWAVCSHLWVVSEYFYFLWVVYNTCSSVFRLMCAVTVGFYFTFCPHKFLPSIRCTLHVQLLTFAWALTWSSDAWIKCAKQYDNLNTWAMDASIYMYCLLYNH